MESKTADLQAKIDTNSADMDMQQQIETGQAMQLDKLRLVVLLHLSCPINHKYLIEYLSDDVGDIPFLDYMLSKTKDPQELARVKSGLKLITELAGPMKGAANGTV